MKYAIIGCGRIARKHIAAALENGLEIVALCDVNLAAAKVLQEEFALKKAELVEDFRWLLTAGKVDIIAVCTPSDSHYEIGESCINAGVHTIIEKPMSLSILDSNRLLVAAEKSKARLCVSHQNRFNYAAQKVFWAVEKGHFGKISHMSLQVRWNRGAQYYAQGDWRGSYLTDGGALMNQSIHGIDLLLWFMNSKPKRVYGVCKNRLHPYIQGEDIGVAIVEFANGAVATIEGTVNVYPENLEEKISIFGEKGTVILGGKSAQQVLHSSFLELDDFSIPIETESIYGNGHSRLYKEFLADILQRRKILCSGAVGKNAVELVLAIYKSQKEKIVVDLPLVDFSSWYML